MIFIINKIQLKLEDFLYTDSILGVNSCSNISPINQYLQYESSKLLIMTKCKMFTSLPSLHFTIISLSTPFSSHNFHNPQSIWM